MLLCAQFILETTKQLTPEDTGAAAPEVMEDIHAEIEAEDQ